MSDMTLPAITFATLHVRPSAQAVALAAGCLAASLPEQNRARCRLLDLYPGPSPEEQVAAILAEPADLLVLPTYLWNRLELQELCTLIRARAPQLLIACGGPEASPQAELLLLAGTCDLVVRGEGEGVFPQLVAKLKRGWQNLPGLSWSGPQGIVHNPAAGQLNPTELTSPWLTGMLQPTTDGGVLWEAARGCTFGCDFCFDSGGHHAIRPIPEERLIAELKFFQAAGVSQIWVLDSTFNFPPKRGKRLLRLLREHAPNIHFHLEAKADFLDGETAALLGELTCSVQVGLQSADPKILRGVKRPFDAQVFTRAMHLLNSEGVTFGLDVIFGLPHETAEGFCNSIDFALQFAPNHIDIFPLAILPGTELARRAAAEKIDYLELPPYTVTATPQLPKSDLENCRDLAAAIDLFYNTGRAVGFLPSLLKTLKLEPIIFFRNFARWLQEEQGLFREVMLATESWNSSEVLAMQKSYVQQLLLQQKRNDLLPAALDLLRYHFHHAETHLGPEVLPTDQAPTGKAAWDTVWCQAPGVHLVPFHYEIVDLLDMEGADLAAITDLLRPVGSTALFIRRGAEVWCESLEDEFLRLLNGCDGKQTPAEIFAGSIAPAEGMELVDFAVGEGLLTVCGPT